MTIKEQLEPIIRRVGIREVARRAGMSHVTLHQWFSGKQRMSDEQLERIAQAVGHRLVLKRDH